MDTIVMDCHLSLLPRLLTDPFLELRGLWEYFNKYFAASRFFVVGDDDFSLFCSMQGRLVINWLRLTFFWPLALPWLWSNPHSQQTLIASLYHLTPSERQSAGQTLCLGTQLGNYFKSFSRPCSILFLILFYFYQLSTRNGRHSNPLTSWIAWPCWKHEVFLITAPAGSLE